MLRYRFRRAWLSMDGRWARLTTGLALKVMSWVGPYGMAGRRRVVAGKVWYFDVGAAAAKAHRRGAPARRSQRPQLPGRGSAAASFVRSAVTNGVAR